MSLAATPRRLRPASFGGHEVRQAAHSKAVQDLTYRSEYLATLMSSVTDPRHDGSGTEAKPTQDVIGVLATSTMPQLLGATALGLGEQKVPIECSDHLLSGMHTMLGSFRLPAAPPEALPRPLDCLRSPQEILKVKTVKGMPRDAVGRDHAHFAEMEVARHAESCRAVEHVSEGLGDTSGAGLSFARFFWRQTNGGAGGDARPGSASLSQFCRLDGEDPSSTTRFCLTEGHAVLVRSEGQDAFHSHALASCARPVRILAEGHYFEVQIRSVFRSVGRADRPKQLEPRSRREGLMIGMTTTKPSAIDPKVRSAREVPRSWCVSTSGRFYASSSAALGRTRAVNQDRVQSARSWHAKAPRSEQLTCTWPPPEVGAVNRKLETWVSALGEGDRLGLLVTPFGGIVVTVNGEKHLFIPDAGVPADAEMYPLVESYNHVRSIRFVPGALPPR